MKPRARRPVTPVQPNFVAGRWVRAGALDTVVDPYRGTSVTRVPWADASQMEAAISAAAASASALARMPRYERAAILRGIADRLAASEDDLARLIVRESGKPLQYARAEVRRAVVTFRLASEETVRFGGEWLPVDLEPRVEGTSCVVERFPVGPVAAISPFNFPLNLAAHKVAPAIAVGNPIVLKPPVQAPTTALRLGAIALDAGLPERALSILHCQIPVAEALATDPRLKMLSFTGSVAVGWALKEKAPRKKVVLELGGNCPVLVHDDVDVDAVAPRVAIGAFASAGQVCIKVQRVFVHRRRYERFVARFVEEAEKLAVGDPMKPDTVVGPLIDARAADRVMQWIDEAVDARAEVLTGARRRKNVVWPTVIANAGPRLKVSAEEVFGPVATVAPYRTLEEGLRLANDTRFGLQAGIFTNRIDVARQAFEGLEVGGVILNDTSMLRVDDYPYGGVKDSGFGREGVKYAMEEMTEPRAFVARQRG